jgi:5-methylcytosine-specific restriction endonuclease McrA
MEVLKMPFEVFKSKHARASRGPRIGLSRRGYFSLNKFAFELLGRPSRVLLLYDSERALVGLKAADENVPYSYGVVQQGNSESYILAAKAFCDYCGITYDEVQHFVPRSQDDLVVFEVREQED